jgi:hypothetical protein
VATSGQGANSQFWPLRPTALPSGHNFASIVQATGAGGIILFTGFTWQPVNKKISDKKYKIFFIVY